MRESLLWKTALCGAKTQVSEMDRKTASMRQAVCCELKPLLTLCSELCPVRASVLAVSHRWWSHVMITGDDHRWDGTPAGFTQSSCCQSCKNFRGLKWRLCFYDLTLFWYNSEFQLFLVKLQLDLIKIRFLSRVITTFPHHAVIILQLYLWSFDFINI